MRMPLQVFMGEVASATKIHENYILPSFSFTIEDFFPCVLNF